MSRKRNYATSSPASRALMLMSNGILLDLLLLIATTRMSMAQIIVIHITAAMYILLMTVMLNRTPTLTMLWCWHNQSHHLIRITSTKPLANMRQCLDERTAMFTSCSTTTNTRTITINIITTRNTSSTNNINRNLSINISLNTTAEAHSTIATSFTIITPLITLIPTTEAIITVTKRIMIPMRIQD